MRYRLTKRIQSRRDCRQTTQRLLRVHLREVGPFGRHVGLSENGFHGTFRNAGVTVNARLGINVQHVVIEMKGFNRTNERAIGVAAVYTGFSNDVGHSAWNLLCFNVGPASIFSLILTRVAYLKR